MCRYESNKKNFGKSSRHNGYRATILRKSTVRGNVTILMTERSHKGVMKRKTRSLWSQELQGVCSIGPITERKSKLTRRRDYFTVNEIGPEGKTRIL